MKENVGKIGYIDRKETTVDWESYGEFLRLLCVAMRG